jgi:biopolymer transport protein ExbD
MLIRMARTYAEQDEAIAGINVTPLVDVMLVLLIILLVTAKQITSQAVPLDLSKTAGPAQAEVVLSVVLAADGTMQLDGRSVANDDALLPLATSARARGGDVRAVIQADRAVPHGRVIHVLDLLKQAHVDKIAFGRAAVEN